MLQQIILRFWQRRGWLSYCLLPLSWLYYSFISLRRVCYQLGLIKTYQASVPVVIVGNITVGGVGKTPLVIALAEFLKQHGFKPGIVSRGYGGKAAAYPVTVNATSKPQEVGDEPLLIYRRTFCPVVVDPKRINAVQTLLQQSSCDVIISDDGLQHYALGRKLEIAVVEGERRYGNQYCLPAGPLREPISRLKSVDFIVCNGKARLDEYEMNFEVIGLRNVANANQVKALQDFKGQKVHAIAGIGNPQRFFSVLKNAGLELIEHSFPDHHAYAIEELQFNDDLPVIMTEKDAVKCLGLQQTKYWYVWGNAKLTTKFWEKLLGKLQL